MLSTHFKKNAQLIAATADENTGKVGKTRIYFYPPEECEDSSSSSEDDSDDDFRIPMKKRKKDKEDNTVYKCKSYETIVPYYDPKERITMFIAGPQNCGKSYFISKFLKTYKLMHPKRPIYLITGLLEKDKNFEGFNIRAIDLSTPEAIQVVDSLNLETMRVDDKTGKRCGCLMIFDDTDRIRDKALMNKVYKLLDDALANGRDHATQAGNADIDVVVTNHEINDYQRTRGITTNCNYVVLFPYYSLSSQMRIMMDKIGVSKEMQGDIIKYKGRDVIFRKTAPLYCVMKKKIFLLRK